MLPELLPALTRCAESGDIVAQEALKELEKLIDALMFYADPMSYMAVLIVGDNPCGEFANDISNMGEPFGWRHGKRARVALGLEDETIQDQTE